MVSHPRLSSNVEPSECVEFSPPSLCGWGEASNRLAELGEEEVVEAPLHRMDLLGCYIGVVYRSRVLSDVGRFWSEI